MALSFKILLFELDRRNGKGALKSNNNNLGRKEMNKISFENPR